jgi:putative ATP-binding cassette transporter
MLDLLKVIGHLLRFSRDIRYSRSLFVAVIVSGTVTGLANSGLIALINTKVSAQETWTDLMSWSFVGLCVALPVGRVVSQLLLVYLTQRTIFSFRIRLCKKILSAPLRRLEEVGHHRVLAALTDDVGRISGALVDVPVFCMHVAIVLGCLTYLGWLSPELLLMVLGFLVVGGISYQLPLMKALGFFRRGREVWDELFQHFRGVAHGVKELKLNRRRRDEFVERALVPTSAARMRYSFLGSALATAARGWGQALFFLLIGLILFVYPGADSMRREVVTGYVLTILYMVTPIEFILNTFPILGRARIAFDKLVQLGLALDEEEEELISEEVFSHSTAAGALELQDVTFGYYDERNGRQFTLGPVSLAVSPGEVLFLVGGNGSGKTTLAKLLVGLYSPDSGRILLEGREVSDGDRDSYRQSFSTVFSDFYLFERLFGLDGHRFTGEADRRLAELELDEKVSIEGGALSTVDLSAGQRKRLALLIAYLEDRPIYVFDEWAADQDPEFKRVFYHRILSELKARGKVVIVISHDDRFFHLADRVVKLESGRVVATGPGEDFVHDAGPPVYDTAVSGDGPS